jgi:predicted aspartyl protease
MGTFWVGCQVENLNDRSRTAALDRVLVDSGSEMTWIPSSILVGIGVEPAKTVEFQMANGTLISRKVGFAFVRVDDHFTVDEVVFGEGQDLPLLGARSLEGLNLRVDSRQKKLVAGGPLLAA